MKDWLAKRTARVQAQWRNDELSWAEALAALHELGWTVEAAARWLAGH